MRISDWSSDVCSSDLIRHDHLTIGRGGEGRLRGVGEFQPCFVEFFQNAEADLVTGLINLLEVRIEDIEFQFEIKRTRAETDKAAADARAAIGFDNFLKPCGNACGVRSEEGRVGKECGS